ncbi:MAG: tetrathionate reductase subunit, partial [Rhodocyclaceae bacterium]|nr:tetrathionate reductase subunit [Rhodocyclaceae bacterium]
MNKAFQISDSAARAASAPASPSRRNFLRGVPVVTAAAAMAPTPAIASTGKRQWAMLIDVRKCIGCQACTVSCIQENAVPEGSFRTVVSTYSVKLTDSAQP